MTDTPGQRLESARRSKDRVVLKTPERNERKKNRSKSPLKTRSTAAATTFQNSKLVSKDSILKNSKFTSRDTTFKNSKFASAVGSGRKSRKVGAKKDFNKKSVTYEIDEELDTKVRVSPKKNLSPSRTIVIYDYDKYGK
jgi:hypothetical protein